MINRIFELISFLFARRNPDLHKCTGCLIVSYCDRSCQREGWKDHKGECKNLAKVKPNVPTDSVQLIGRIILKLQVCEQQIILMHIKIELQLLLFSERR